jgi:hypothetical protein
VFITVREKLKLATSREVASSIPDYVIGFSIHLIFPATQWTESLTEIITRDLPKGKGFAGA